MCGLIFKKKKIWILLLFVTLLFCACGVDREGQRAARDEGIAAMTAGDYAKAVECFNKALSFANARVTEAEVNICYYKAAAQFLAGATGDAVSTYTDLLTYDEKDAQAYFLRGSVFLNDGDLENGMKDYEAAVAAAPMDYDMYIGIYENLMALGHAAEAEGVLNAALEISGEAAEDYLNRGRIYMILDQYEVAKTTLQKAVDMGNVDAKVSLAEVYHMQGDEATARKLLDEYVHTENLKASSLATAGDLLLSQGSYEEALAVYRQGLTLENPDSVRGLLRGEVAALEFTGDFAGARDKANEYIAAYPSDGAILRELVFLNSR